MLLVVVQFQIRQSSLITLLFYCAEQLNTNSISRYMCEVYNRLTLRLVRCMNRIKSNLYYSAKVRETKYATANNALHAR